MQPSDFRVPLGPPVLERLGAWVVVPPDAEPEDRIGSEVDRVPHTDQGQPPIDYTHWHVQGESSHAGISLESRLNT